MQTGRIYAMDSIIHNVSYFLRTAVLQNIYIATVDWFQGFIWFCLSSLALLSAAILLVVHFTAKKAGLGDT